MDLPHSDDCFVQAFPAETTEAFLEGHVRAFQYFGVVPARILYDNTTLAVARILGDGETAEDTRLFELQSHYLFAEKFGRPARATRRARWKILWAMRGGTSWCRFRERRAGKISTRILEADCRSAVNAGCAGRRRPSVSVLSATARRCCPCRRCIRAL